MTAVRLHDHAIAWALQMAGAFLFGGVRHQAGAWLVQVGGRRHVLPDAEFSQQYQSFSAFVRNSGGRP